jgi:PAS domain S-box-containing protein
MFPKSIPLRVLLVATFVLQTTVAVGLIIWLSWRSEQQTISEHNEHLQKDSFNSIQAQLNRYFDASTLINQLNAQALAEQILSLDKPAPLTCQFWQQRSLFTAIPVTAIYAGGADGRFSGLEFQGNQTWEISRVGPETGRRFYAYATDAQGEATKLLRRGPPYDPRTRPWYQQALRSRQPLWSKVYGDFNEQRLKLTLSQPIYTSSRKFMGVVGVDFTLTQISDFLRSLLAQDLTALMIVDSDGQIVATSTEDPPYVLRQGVPQQLNFAALKNPLFSALTPTLARMLQQSFVPDIPISQTVQVQGQPWILWVAPLKDRYKLDLWVVGVMSEPNFMQQIPNHSRATLLLCVVVLMTAVLLGLITARKLSQGLQQLIQGGQAIAQGNLNQTFPNSFIHELSQLSDTFNRMAGHLRQSFDELESQVQNRTAALKKSEEKFAKIFYRHPNPVTISRLQDGRFIEANDSALSLLGIERDGLMDRTISELDIGLDPSQREQVSRYIANHRPVRGIESHLKLRSGEMKTILYSADVIDLEGKPHLVSIVQDITDRKQVEEALRRSEEKFAKFFHFNPNPITISRVDDGYFIDANAGAIAFLETDWDAVIGKTSYDLKIWVDLQDRQQFLETLQARQAVRSQECRLRTQSGAIRTVLYSAELIEMGGQLCLISNINDISDRRKAEEDLQQAKVQAEEANQAKSLFFSKMSHELRTPLNAILGFAQVLNLDKNLSTKQQEHLDIISRSGEHLLEMINEVLDIAKIEAGRVEVRLNRFDLHRCLTTLKAMFSLKAVGKGIALLLEKTDSVPQFIQADEGKLRQILMNLLSNAIKFTEKGYVRLMVRVAKHPHSGSQEAFAWNAPSPPNALYFYIEDTGLGIPPSELGEIFNAFMQSTLNRASHVGTGLGLTISREFIGLLGGEIAVSSSLGQGTLFQFYIPFAPVPDLGEILEPHLNIQEMVDQSNPDAMIAEASKLEKLAEGGQTCQLLTLECFKNLPIDWVEQVHRAAQAVNNGVLYELIDQLPETHGVLAGTLSHLVQNFRCDMIFEVTERLV